MNTRYIQTICTIGPNTNDPKLLGRLIQEGMDVARFNFSHCQPEEFRKARTLLEKLSSKRRKKVRVLQDLQGPRMRVGMLPKRGIVLEDGKEQLFTISKKGKGITMDHPQLFEDIRPGDPIYLSNGDIQLVTLDKTRTQIKARVLRGGILYARKSVNLPRTNVTVSSLTEKDIRDVELGVKGGVDFIALSFVTNVSDILLLRKYIRQYSKGRKRIRIIAKIEKPQALSHLDGIIEAADAIMVARGDLGIELPLEEIPLFQKSIIARANILGTPTIVATQMLMSMVNHFFPTRAEVSDVANAVLDGASGLMLSDETAFGNYPVESLQYLVRIIERTERFQSGQPL